MLKKQVTREECERERGREMERETTLPIHPTHSQHFRTQSLRLLSIVRIHRSLLCTRSHILQLYTTTTIYYNIVHIIGIVAGHIVCMCVLKNLFFFSVMTCNVLYIRMFNLLHTICYYTSRVGLYTASGEKLY